MYGFIVNVDNNIEQHQINSLVYNVKQYRLKTISFIVGSGMQLPF